MVQNRRPLSESRKFRLIRYRAFRNNDPPRLADLWRACRPQRGLVQPMSAVMFERLILSKPYFDRHGLVVAVAAGVPVGFVHAGFGPTADRKSLDFRRGVICFLLVHPDHREQGIGSQLLQHGEAYLRQSGSVEIHGGCTPEVNPFYLGLYGGSEMPGILDSTPKLAAFLQERGYDPVGRRTILHCDLRTFRPIVDRQQLQIRRRTRVHLDLDPTDADWWSACTWGSFERLVAQLRTGDDTELLAHVAGWFMEPLAASWGVRAVGLTELVADYDHRREGLATFLLGELFRHLQQDRVSLVEAQLEVENTPALRLAEKLGFRPVDSATRLRKK